MKKNQLQQPGRASSVRCIWGSSYMQNSIQAHTQSKLIVHLLTIPINCALPASVERVSSQLSKHLCELRPSEPVGLCLKVFVPQMTVFPTADLNMIQI